MEESKVSERMILRIVLTAGYLKSCKIRCARNTIPCRTDHTNQIEPQNPLEICRLRSRMELSFAGAPEPTRGFVIQSKHLQTAICRCHDDSDMHRPAPCRHSAEEPPPRSGDRRRLRDLSRRDSHGRGLQCQSGSDRDKSIR